MPYSPKATLVPPFAVPERSGRCCLRCLVRRGISMTSALLAWRRRRLSGSSTRVGRLLAAGGGRPVCAVRRARATTLPTAARWPLPAAAFTPVAAWSLARSQRGRSRLSLGPRRRGLTAVDPDLHANPAERGPRLVETEVDVRTQRVERHPALAIKLRP